MEQFWLAQIAAAVFLGNTLTLCLFKGWQRMKRENRFEWVTAFYWLGPLAFFILVMIGSTAEPPAAPSSAAEHSPAALYR